MAYRILVFRWTTCLVCLVSFLSSSSSGIGQSGCLYDSGLCDGNERCNEGYPTGQCEPDLSKRHLNDLNSFLREQFSQDPASYDSEQEKRDSRPLGDENGGMFEQQSYWQDSRPVEQSNEEKRSRLGYARKKRREKEEQKREEYLKQYLERQQLRDKIERQLERQRRREEEYEFARRLFEREQFLHGQGFAPKENIFKEARSENELPPVASFSRRADVEVAAPKHPVPDGYSHDIRVLHDANNIKSKLNVQSPSSDQDVRKNGLPPSNLESEPAVVPGQSNPLATPLQDKHEAHAEQKVDLGKVSSSATQDSAMPKNSDAEMTVLNTVKPESEEPVKPVLVSGKVSNADILKDAPEAHPSGNDYQRVKEFFQSQQISSIVDVPKTEKKQKIEFFQKGGTGDSAKKDEGVTLLMEKPISLDNAKLLVNRLQKRLWTDSSLLNKPVFSDVEVDDSSVSFRVDKDSGQSSSSIVDKINDDLDTRELVQRESGAKMVAAAASNVKSDAKVEVHSAGYKHPRHFTTILIVLGCVSLLLLIVVCIYMIMRKAQDNKFKPVAVPGQEAADDYRELCRQLKATQGVDMPITTQHLKQHNMAEKEKGLLNGKPPKYNWSEEPVVPKMDILTGHVVLSYMEDHLNNKDRLNKEWEALCSYEAEPNSTRVASDSKNGRKNRYQDVLPYDHTRVILRETVNATGSDYINASFIYDHDPRKPAYVATQGPLAHTVSDFWQMVWEQGVVVIVNLTKLSDLGMPQCHRYWPEKGCETYHVYEVHLVSEHIWCDDYLVRSFYLKNLQTNETRTITQFHYLSWPDLNVPPTPKPLLEFRRKVNKCFRGGACPVVVHCSGGVGRTGTYILIDMVLNKMMRGAKEIDIAATVEHLRDQRPHMVKTKAQFEFALTAVAEEVNAILQAIPK